MTTGNKYLPLLRHLVSSLKEQEYLRVTVVELEELVGPLPPRARRERYWTTSSVAHRNWRFCGFDCATLPSRARGGRSNGAAAQLRSQQIGQEALDGAAGGGPAAARVVTPLPAIAPSGPRQRSLCDPAQSLRASRPCLGPRRIPPDRLQWLLRRLAQVYGLILMPTAPQGVLGRGEALRAVLRALVALVQWDGSCRGRISPPSSA